MKLITFKPITFLLKFSATTNSSSNYGKRFTVISINKKNLSFLGDVIVALKSKQKRIGFSFIKKIPQILQYILVGKDKSVVTIGRLITPTVSTLQQRYG